MLIKKTAIAMTLALSLVASAFAGTEDWNGKFTFQDSNGELQTVTHTPAYVRYLFFTMSSCLRLHKGASINGMVIPEDVNFCTNANIETFTGEVQKLGFITSKTVVAGSTYTD